VDWTLGLADACARSGGRVALQGNLDPAAVVAGIGPALDGTRAVLRQAGGAPGHVFNLGHGVLPETDPGVLAEVVEVVHSEGRVEGPPA